MLADAMRQVAEALNAAADAKARLEAKPQIEVKVAVKPQAGSLAKALAEELDNQQAEAFVRKIRERLDK